MFFAFPRFWAQHAISMWKDPVFSVLIYFYSLKLFDLIWSKGEVATEKNYILQCIFCVLGIGFSRNNGIYIMIFSVSIIAFWILVKYLEWGKCKKVLISSVICIH